MPQNPIPLDLTPKLQQLRSGIVKVFTGPGSNIYPGKIVAIYSHGVLSAENLLGDAAPADFSQQMTSQLNKAKTLITQLGVRDITKAPAIPVNQAALKVIPGQLKVPARKWLDMNRWIRIAPQLQQSSPLSISTVHLLNNANLRRGTATGDFLGRSYRCSFSRHN